MEIIIGKKNSNRTGSSTFAITHKCFYFFLVFVNFVSHKPTHRPKFAKELETLPPEKNNFFKFLPLLKKFKTCHRTADTVSETPTDSSLTVTEDRRPAYNMRLASCGVRWLNSSAVFQINFSAGLTVSCLEIPPIAKARKRYQQA